MVVLQETYYAETAERPSRLFLRLSLLAICAIVINLVFMALYNASALLGNFICCGVFFLFSLFITRSTRDRFIKKNSIRLYFIAYGAISTLSLIRMLINYHNFGNYFSANPDEIYFFNNARFFFETGKINYSIFDMFGGSLIFIYRFFGIEAGLMCLMPMNWGSASLLAVVAYLLVRKVTGSSANSGLFLMALLCNFMFLDASTYYLRDVVGSLFLLLAIFFIFAKNTFFGGVNTVLAFFIRGGNGLMALASYPFLRYPHLLERRKILAIIVTVCILLTGYYLSDYLVNFAGSALRAINSEIDVSYGLFEGRRMLMERGIEVTSEYGTFDTTQFFYRLGPVGWPFRYMTNFFAPVRMAHFFGYVRAQWGGLVPGVNPEALLSGIYIVTLPFVAPYLLYGLYSSFKSKRYFPWLFYFFILVSVVVIFSQQGRHRLMFIVLFPLFAEIGRKEAFAKNKIMKMKLVKYATMILIYLPNLYLLLR